MAASYWLLIVGVVAILFFVFGLFAGAWYGVEKCNREDDPILGQGGPGAGMKQTPIKR